MLEVPVAASRPVSPVGLAAFEAVVGVLGSRDMDEVSFRAISEIAPIDELFAFERPLQGGPPRTVLSAGTGAAATHRALAYRDRFHRLDPLNGAFGRADAAAGLMVLRVEAGDIDDPTYRRACYNEPEFVEKLSIAGRRPSGWLVMSLFRCQGTGRFEAGELRRLVGFGRLMLPLLARHDVLTAQWSGQKLSVEALEDRLAVLCADLTGRERAVSARTVAGMTAEAIGLDLGIATTSVLTYRRRAYQRLNITSAFQLCGLLLQ